MKCKVTGFKAGGVTAAVLLLGLSLVLASCDTAAAASTDDDTPAEGSYGVVRIILPSTDENILNISSTKPLVIELYPEDELDQAESGTPSYTQTITAPTAQTDFTLPAGETFYACGYHDVDNNGVDVGDFVGNLAPVTALADTTVTETYYPLDTGMGLPNRALVDTAFLGNVLHIEYNYTGETPVDDEAGGASLCFVVSKSSDPMSTGDWVYYANEMPRQGEGAILGCDDSETLYFFFFLDINHNEAYDGTDKISSTAGEEVFDTVQAVPLETYVPGGTGAPYVFEKNDDDMSPYPS